MEKIESSNREKIRKMIIFLRIDWPLLPYLVILVTGLLVSLLDFIFLQNFTFQVFFLIGIVFFTLGGYLHIIARLDLKTKAGFRSFAKTMGHKQVDDHKLMTNGLYKYIRHPLYLGQILSYFSFTLIFSSFYGALLMMITTIFLLFRIKIEENILSDVFGEKYQEYQRNTKKLIPFIY